ncbi:NUDIX hydrolase [Candidatus Woesearchaeota archaeon]|nr:MAG: NUDIX hydrolase [Candidatus Woesearchaeota archaeon]
MIQTVDAIIIRNNKLLVIERKNFPFGLALPGGKVKPGETKEQALVREVKEEVGLDVDNHQEIGYYDTPGRDPRGDYASTAYLCEVSGEATAQSDAKSLLWIDLNDLEQYKDRFCFDHYTIVRDALGLKK